MYEKIQEFRLIKIPPEIYLWPSMETIFAMPSVPFCFSPHIPLRVLCGSATAAGYDLILIEPGGEIHCSLFTRVLQLR